jgi:hypothetical protein
MTQLLLFPLKLYCTNSRENPSAKKERNPQACSNDNEDRDNSKDGVHIHRRHFSMVQTPLNTALMG